MGEVAKLMEQITNNDGSIKTRFVVMLLEATRNVAQNLSKALHQLGAPPMVMTELSLVAIHTDRAIKEVKQIYD